MYPKILKSLNIDANYLKSTWDTYGYIPETFELADKSVIPGLLAELPMYHTEIRRNRDSGMFRIPYLLTEFIIKAAYDPNILAVVSAILGTDELVCWGPNIQSSTPNEAGLWHTDVESWLWPSISLFIGLEGCNPENSTRCIPSSFRIPCQPWFAANNTNDNATLKAANLLNPECNKIVQSQGFGNGKFYLLNAKCWHAGHPGTIEQPSISTGRKMLYIHYDKASNYRMPYHDNYIERTWFDYPAVYFPIEIGGRTFEVNREIYNTQGHNYNGVLPEGFQFLDN